MAISNGSAVAAGSIISDLTDTWSPVPLYKQDLEYDAFGHITSRETWDVNESERSFTATYANNRKTSGGWPNGSTDTYDAAGNVVMNIASTTPPDDRMWKFDAAGRMTEWQETSAYLGDSRHQQGETLTFDGDGRAAKRLKRNRIWAYPANGWSEVAEYHLISSVTGRTTCLLYSCKRTPSQN